MNKIKYCLMILVVMVMFKGVFAQTGDMRIHRTTGTITSFPLTKITSLEFPDEVNLKIVHTYSNHGSPYEIAIADFDSITFEKIEGSVTDIEGKEYRTVKIDNDWWMAENLNTVTYNTGDAIPEVPLIGDWKDYPTGGYCNYDNNASYAAKYGRLYNWNAVNTGNLAPAGWHVSTHAERLALGSYLQSTAGENLKSDGPPPENNLGETYMHPMMVVGSECYGIPCINQEGGPPSGKKWPFLINVGGNYFALIFVTKLIDKKSRYFSQLRRAIMKRVHL